MMFALMLLMQFAPPPPKTHCIMLTYHKQFYGNDGTTYESINTTPTWICGIPEGWENTPPKRRK